MNLSSLNFFRSLRKDNQQYAVIGLGRFGRSVCSTLHKLGYEVLATDIRTVSLFAEPHRIVDVDEAIEKIRTVLPDLDTRAKTMPGQFLACFATTNIGCIPTVYAKKSIFLRHILGGWDCA